jgi:Domain of unknown function (DUF4803)
MWVCPSSPNSLRRYEYIEYENGKLLGEKQSCQLGTSKVSRLSKCDLLFEIKFDFAFVG